MDRNDIFTGMTREEIDNGWPTTGRNLVIKQGLRERIDTEGAGPLQSYVLNSVGVGDYSKVVDFLEPDDEELLRTNILLLYEVGDFAKRQYVATLNEESIRFDSRYQDERYPIFKGGMVDKISSTRLFKRLEGINQINITSWYPLKNEQTRATHSINVAIYMLRALQAMYEKDKESLAGRLRSDFDLEAISTEGIDDDAVVALAARLTAATGMLHDLFTPAGGDVVKRVVGMDEEVDMELLLTSQDNAVKDVRQILVEFGITGDLLQFVVSCVKGESESLIGDMIHPKNKTNALDIDQIAYTLWDSRSAGILNNPRLYKSSDKLDFNQKRKFIESISWAQDILNDEYRDYPENLHPSMQLSISEIDPIDGYELDEEGRLINSKPDKLMAVLALRLFMSTEMYRGTKMVGLDKELEAGIKEMIELGKCDRVFDKDNLLTISTSELYDLLRSNTENQGFLQLLQSISNEYLPNRYSGEIVDFSENEINPLKGVGFKFNTGMDSLVRLDDGEVVTLSKFMGSEIETQRGLEEPIFNLISQLMATYNKDTVRLVSPRSK